MYSKMLYIPHILTSVVVLYLVRKYRVSKWGKCLNQVKLDGKVAIVTGGNSGIGYEIAKELAKRNAQVILACRDMDKARDAIVKIKQSVLSNPVLIAMELDLASLKSVKKFATTIIKDFPNIDILVNNAGVSFPPKTRVITKDDLEVHFGVNHLGHFYLTNLLLDTLQSSRVVIISSSLHERGKIHLNNLNSCGEMEVKNLYANSKLANIYFCRELARRTEKRGINVYACCPGWVYTKLFRHSIKWYHFITVAPIAFFFMRSPSQGCQTPIFCATDPSLEKESGLVYRDCKLYKSKHKFDEKIGKGLWEESEVIIKKIMGSDSGLK
ncbi:unnamed protein product [Brassicogethes aeneus]|uniref:Uncharacterized protein n=1 Tax=Brassicogethes aeneus TaxID=1431903 RepID=A0A9P0FCW3_BRAAE|nr:unnamed protein product [Brassicogethes aeneus]